MPNHVTHRIVITGADADIRAFVDRCIVTTHRDATEHQPAFDEQTFDFSTLIPMPEELKNVTDGSTMQWGLMLVGRADLARAYYTLENMLDWPWVKDAGVTTLDELRAYLIKTHPTIIADGEAAAGLVRFLNDASTNGVREALRTLNLESLAGRPIEEVFAGLADYICPEGGSIDEGIARDAFVETIADLAGAGITDIDALTPGQIQTVFELYATHAIEARICNDIGTKVVTLPANSRAAERVQAQLRDFIQRGVSDAINSAGVNIQSLTPDAVMGFVTDVYQSAFDVLQTMGDGEAAK